MNQSRVLQKVVVFIGHHSLLTVFGILVLSSNISFASAISDPSGDSTSHDIASASAFFDSTTMFMTATFHPGTLDPSNFAFFFSFDLDEDPSTGTQPPATFPLGGDETVQFNSLFDPSFARVNGFLTPISFGTDSFSVSVPLSILADDGQANYGLKVGNPTTEFSFIAHDTAPDSATGNPLTTPTTFIPEPSTVILAAIGLVGLAAFGWRRRKR